MNIDWKTKQFSQESCHGVLIKKCHNKIKIMGEFKNKESNNTVMYWAGNPVQSSHSFSGSGLPYSSPTQAYDRSINVGAVSCNSGKFEFTIKTPNSYYVNHGTQLIPPHVHIRVLDSNQNKIEQFMIKLGEPLKGKLLHFPPNRTPEFYNNRDKLPFRSQEQILRDSSFQAAQKSCSFWGLKPAQ